MRIGARLMKRLWRLASEPPRRTRRRARFRRRLRRCLRSDSLRCGCSGHTRGVYHAPTLATEWTVESDPVTTMHSIDAVRRSFPALSKPTAFLENAGGSQLPASVIDAMSAYMRDAYVQLGAGYPESVNATETVESAHRWMETFFNARDAGRAILGASSSALLRMIAECMRSVIRAGDEIVIAESGHEANISPWLMLEQCGARIRWWRAGDDATGCPLDSLDDLLNERTRLVCFHHVSNLLGGVVPVTEVVRRARAVGARTVVDGVAFAPHRAIDVHAWGCDWYVFSTYKVFGPHMGALFGRHEALDELTGPGHFFVPRTQVPAKFELGGVSHEGCAGLLGLRPYLALLAGAGATQRLPESATPDSIAGDRAMIERAFAVIEANETALTERLVDGLLAIDGLEMLGHRTHGPERVATVSVRHRARPSSEIAKHAHARHVAIRNGHMYSHRLCESMGIDATDGVARVSAVHYNTPQEIDRAVDAIASAVRSR